MSLRPTDASVRRCADGRRGGVGDGDVLGCLNLLTPSGARAAGLVRSGRAYTATATWGARPPLSAGKAPPRGARTGSHDDLIELNTQSHTQWGGFRHVATGARPLRGVADEDHGVPPLGRRGHRRRAGVASRRWRDAAGDPPLDAPEAHRPEDVSVPADEGVAVEAASPVVRTGWLTGTGRSTPPPGPTAESRHPRPPPRRDTARRWGPPVAPGSPTTRFEMWRGRESPAASGPGHGRGTEETFVNKALIGLPASHRGAVRPRRLARTRRRRTLEAMLTPPTHLKGGARHSQRAAIR